MIKNVAQLFCDIDILLFYSCIQQIYHFLAKGSKVVNLLKTLVE